jgi:multidrug efflux pump subunit AcrB
MSKVDFLDEDIEIRNQKFCVLSYTLPPPGSNNKGKQRIGFDTPMIKVRGSYSTVEDCESRIETLKKSDPYFHMYIASVGVWGSLLTEEQHKESGTSAVFMNKDMNDFMQGYKQSQDKKTEEFEERKRALVEKAKFDGSKEGQALLASKKENPVSVRDRMVMAEKAVAEYKEKLAEMEEMYNSAKELYATYTEEEITEAELQIKADQLKIKEM